MYSAGNLKVYKERWPKQSDLSKWGSKTLVMRKSLSLWGGYCPPYPGWLSSSLLKGVRGLRVKRLCLKGNRQLWYKSWLLVFAPKSLGNLHVRVLSLGEVTLGNSHCNFSCRFNALSKFLWSKSCRLFLQCYFIEYNFYKSKLYCAQCTNGFHFYGTIKSALSGSFEVFWSRVNNKYRNVFYFH